MPYIQRPRPPREAGQSGQPALEANGGAHTNSLRAKALRSNSVCESEHEVWLSCGSQTAGVYSERRRWMKGVKHPEQLAGAALTNAGMGKLLAAAGYAFSYWLEKWLCMALG